MTSDVAIKVTGLSKAYRIGLKESQHDTLGSAIASWIKSPIKNYQRVKRLADVRETDTDPDTFWALRNIEFDVKEGEVLGIIGKNGAGKSTLLKVLSRITEPTRGRVEICGRVASLLEVGTGFNPELTGRENVYLNGAILGMRKRELDVKFDNIVAFSGVEKFIDTPVKRYSSGMKVRLAFAVAAHLDPEILIIDEVLAVGDAEFQRKCLGKMHELSAGGGRTVLFVSHDMTAIQGLTSRCLYLHNGSLVAQGETSSIVSTYLADYSDAEFTGHFNLDMANRRGDGTVMIEGVSFCDVNGNAMTTIRSGEPVRLHIKMKSAVKINPQSLQLDMRIMNSMRHAVGTLSTRFDKDFYLISGLPANCLACEIPSLPLAEDDYSIDFWLNYNNGLSDSISEGVRFRVSGADFFQTGQMPVATKHGNVIFTHSWKSS
jgi:lipopolysaccharide transport system ATP-binding protein